MVAFVETVEDVDSVVVFKATCEVVDTVVGGGLTPSTQSTLSGQLHAFISGS